VKKDDFPSIKLFLDGKTSDPVDFKGKIDVNELKSFIVKYSGEQQWMSENNVVHRQLLVVLGTNTVTACWCFFFI